MELLPVEYSKFPIFVHSHRRSGTHFLIDTIRNYFDVFDGFFHTTDNYIEFLKTSNVIIKTHKPTTTFDLDEGHVWRSQDHLAFAILSHQIGKHIYIYRNPRDVLRSLYYFDLAGEEEPFAISKDISFRDYVLGQSLHEKAEGRTRLEYWRDHVSYWIHSPGVMALKFEDIVENNELDCEKIGSFLGIPSLIYRKLPSTGIAPSLTRTMDKTISTAWTDDLEVKLQRHASYLLKELGY